MAEGGRTEKASRDDVRAVSGKQPSAGSPGEPVADLAGAFHQVQVAFAGHNDPLQIGDQEAAAARLRDAFVLLRRAGVADGRLLTGLADGADILAARIWAEVGLGPVTGIYPFLTDKPPADLDAPIGAGVWLDGDALEASGRSAYLAQSRWLLGAADVLVVVWGGERARGAGGTADAVRLALESGVPVLWVHPPDFGPVRLLQPLDAHRHDGFEAVLKNISHGATAFSRPAEAADLRAFLARRGLEAAPTPPAAPTGPARRSALSAVFDKLAHATVWQTYAAFRHLLGGRVRTSLPQSHPPQDMVDQAGFAVLSRAKAVVDDQANRLAAVHRSQQLLLLATAILAAALGTSPTIWPQIKIYAVLAELSLALTALAVWFSADRAGRHERWSHARRLAEQLRLERAAWVLGVSSVDVRERDGLGDVARTVRDLARRAGPATGRFDQDRVARWGRWAIDELIVSQELYHQVQGRRNARIAHSIHRIENLSFAFFIVVLAGFAVAHQVAPLMGFELMPWVGGVVIMTGAVVPAVGAASLALEATLAFGEQSRRSLFLAGRLGEIEASLANPPRLDDLQRAAKAAIRLHISQEDRWSEDATRRRLFRGG